MLATLYHVAQMPPRKTEKYKIWDIIINIKSILTPSNSKHLTIISRTGLYLTQKHGDGGDVVEVGKQS